MDKEFDIVVESKVGQIVMVYANARGRAIVDGLWPDVRWSTDAAFASAHGKDWLFTHVRVVALQPQFEAEISLEKCTPYGVSFAVAAALSRLGKRGRVAHIFGLPPELHVYFIDSSSDSSGNDPRSLFVEYVAPGTSVPL
jgi:hypothetical protein